MKPVFQSVIDKGIGDCFSACLASILEISLSEVPNFNVMQEKYPDSMMPFWDGLHDWLAERGLSYIALHENQFYHGIGTPLSLLDGIYCILTVASQRFESVTHAIVGKVSREGDTTSIEIVHDPNPRNRPYELSEVMRIGFLVAGKGSAV